MAVIAVLAGLAFFTHLEKPKGAQDQAPIGSQANPADSAASMEQITQQIAFLKERLQRNPKDLQVIIDLGNLYYDASMPAQAIEYYNKALVIEPNNADVWTDLGNMHRDLQELDKAIECYQKAVEADPKNKKAWFNLGIVYRFEKNDPKKAVAAWKKFLALVSPDEPHYQSLKQEVDRLEAEQK